MNLFQKMEPSFFVKIMEPPFSENEMESYHHGTFVIQIFVSTPFGNDCSTLIETDRVVHHISLQEFTYKKKIWFFQDHMAPSFLKNRSSVFQTENEPPFLIKR